jgi:hypothetical protein
MQHWHPFGVRESLGFGTGARIHGNEAAAAA